MNRVISCDDCSMQCSTHCDDCVVTFFVRRDDAPDDRGDLLVLDPDEALVVGRLARAGLIPDLKYRLAG